MTGLPGTVLDKLTAGMDRLTELLSECVLVSGYMREAASTASSRDVLCLAADQERLSMALLEVALEFESLAEEIESYGVHIDGASIPSICMAVDRELDSRVLARCEAVAELLRRLCMESTNTRELCGLLRWWHGAEFNMLLRAAGVSVGYDREGLARPGSPFGKTSISV